ncbi:maleylpyruvate isomerase family mycothiol-dependent enzyme [Actinomadura mexicana]|uniref:Maleylpyruvate isomerase n=1 Tax=Actinomadura mexicana TaxID=134959 RepID=A0A238ULM1_9ACTN|nr:maleylpyruvate isomerase family mycothiol-dependent enzyme [Actinomadura mexicana]SNR22914.1 maleylpyruvate isomerase [Actinomadura mexicana]
MNPRIWTDRGTARFLATLDRLTDDELSASTRLDGWTRRHVVAHVHGNAEALRRLLSWAATGVENRMYAGPEQRSAEIEELSALPAGELRALVHRSASRLGADMDALPEDAWDIPVVTAQGRTVPAAEISWMRAREVWVHTVDLDAGVTFADLPDDLNAALVVDAASKQANKGNAARLAEWLTGRTANAPELTPWL